MPTPTYTFSSGERIRSSEMNTNFALLEDCLSLGGGTLTGTLNTHSLIPTASTFDLGSDSLPFQNLYLKTSLKISDTDQSDYLSLVAGSNLTADRTLTITTGDSNRTLTLGGNVTLNDWFDQAVKTTSSPSFAGLSLTQSPVVGDILYTGSSGGSIAGLADVAVGSYLRSGGTTTAPLWSTLKLPNSATATCIPYATSTNTWGESSSLAFTGTVLDAPSIKAENGLSALGASVNEDSGLNISGTIPNAHSTSGYGIKAANITGNSDYTTALTGVYFGIVTADSITVGDVIGYSFGGIGIGSGGAVTRGWGMAIEEISAASNNVLLYLGGRPAPTGTATFTGDWAIYSASDKPSRIAGGVTIGGTSDPGDNNLEVVGTIKFGTDGGSGSTVPLLGNSCPAASGTVKTWLTAIAPDGTTVYIPCWA